MNVSICPICNYEMDCATAIDDKEANPIPGDVSVCLSCGEIFVFDEQLQLTTPTISEMLSWPKETNQLLTRTQRLIRAKRPIK